MAWVLVVLLALAAIAFAAPFNDAKGLQNTIMMTDDLMGNDMIASPLQDSGREKRWYSFTSDTGKRWPKGVLIYDLDPANEMSSQQKKNVLDAFNIIYRNTGGCVSFKERETEQTGYIKIQLNDRDCNCQAGYPDGIVHTMNLQKSWCIGSISTIMHETLHAFGFGHEQVRPDRDNFVWDQPGTERPYLWSKVSTQCLPYDYVSVMHYDGWSAKDPSVKCIGAHCSGSRLSTLDVKRIRMRYGCDPMPSYCKEGIDMSQWGVPKVKEITRSIQIGLVVNTDKNYYYRYYKTNKMTQVMFGLMASNDAHVALSTSTNSNVNTYEIVFGGWGNSKSCIRTRKQGACQASAETKSIISLTKSNTFWISWLNGIIKVGRGWTYGKNVFMQFNHTTPYQVNYLGVSTGWGTRGRWAFK